MRFLRDVAIIFVFKLEFGSCLDLFLESLSRQNLFKLVQITGYKQGFHG